MGFGRLRYLRQTAKKLVPLPQIFCREISAGLGEAVAEHHRGQGGSESVGFVFGDRGEFGSVAVDVAGQLNRVEPSPEEYVSLVEPLTLSTSTNRITTFY